MIQRKGWYMVRTSISIHWCNGWKRFMMDRLQYYFLNMMFWLNNSSSKMFRMRWMSNLMFWCYCNRGKWSWNWRSSGMKYWHMLMSNWMVWWSSCTMYQSGKSSYRCYWLNRLLMNRRQC